MTPFAQLGYLTKSAKKPAQLVRLLTRAVEQGQSPRARSRMVEIDRNEGNKIINFLKGFGGKLKDDMRQLARPHTGWAPPPYLERLRRSQDLANVRKAYNKSYQAGSDASIYTYPTVAAGGLASLIGLAGGDSEES